MKRIIAIVLLIAVSFSICSCAKKTKPTIKISADSVDTIDFKKTYFNDSTYYKQKTVTEKQDIVKITNWLSTLLLEKHEPIEVPVEKVSYVIVLNGKTTRKIILMDNFIIYNSTAYTFKREADLKSVSEKYNLINYPETDTTLELIK